MTNVAIHKISCEIIKIVLKVVAPYREMGHNILASILDVKGPLLL
jgi:hypothetical protein